MPSFAELGWPQVDAPSVYGLIGPARLPGPVVQRLNALLVQPAASPELRPRLEAQGYTVTVGSAEDYAALIHREIRRWREVIAAAGVLPK